MRAVPCLFRPGQSSCFVCPLEFGEHCANSRETIRTDLGGTECQPVGNTMPWKVFLQRLGMVRAIWGCLGLWEGPEVHRPLSYVVMGAEKVCMASKFQKDMRHP